METNLMNAAHLETVWAPRLLSILRIVAAIIFMAHGTQKLLGFPASANPAPAMFSLLWTAGALEIVGGALLALGLFTRPHARRFAQALGQLAKTDRLDAALLARFGALLEPPTRPVLSPTLDAMKELSVALQALIKDRTAALNRQKIVRSALLRRQLAQRLRQIAHQLAAIDAHLQSLRTKDADLAPRLAILMGIPGIAQTTALSLIIDVPELGSLDQSQAASLAGVAPVAHDSGTSRGRRTIRGGRANGRQALSMPALAATRFIRI
jgi:transposase